MRRPVFRVFGAFRGSFYIFGKRVETLGWFDVSADNPAMLRFVCARPLSERVIILSAIILSFPTPPFLRTTSMGRSTVFKYDKMMTDKMITRREGLARRGGDGLE